MKNIILFLLLLPNLCSGQKTNTFLRSDGVYVFDNGIRTYTPATGAMMDTLKNLFRKGESLLSQLYPQTCLSKGMVGAGIDECSSVVVLMFSKTGESLEYVTACRDEKAWESVKKLYAQFQQNSKSAIAAEFGVRKVKYIDDIAFVTVGKNMEAPKGVYQSSSFFRIYKDSLVEKINMPPQALQNANEKFIEKFRRFLATPRVFHFTSLDKTPDAFKGGIQILEAVKY